VFVKHKCSLFSVVVKVTMSSGESTSPKDFINQILMTNKHTETDRIKTICHPLYRDLGIKNIAYTKIQNSIVKIGCQHFIIFFRLFHFSFFVFLIDLATSHKLRGVM